MSEFKHKDIVVDKSDEMRTPEISEMIEEGGLGADKYYDVTKAPAKDKEKSRMIAEGGLGSNKNNDQEETLDNFSVSPADEKKKKK